MIFPPRPPTARRAGLALVASSLALLFLVSVSGAFAAEPKQTFDIPASPAAEALKRFTSQTNNQSRLLYSAEALQGISTNAIRGEMTAQEALVIMLANTGLTAVPNQKTGAIAVRRETEAEAKNGPRAASRNDRPASDEIEDKKVELPVFEVMGSKLLNMDLPRSRDDVQPYIVFDRTAIEHSGAGTVEDFLKQRLTMNTVSRTTSATTSDVWGGSSSVNLRGLGTNQTLILVDGHRLPTSTYEALLFQPSLNGIPVAAIERIEILPTTASGIYGGSATGGVVNVILRRDYAGMEVRLTHENSFDTDSAAQRIDWSAGLTLERGKTNLLLSATYATGNTLAMGDRDFAEDGTARILVNNPAFFNPPSAPPLGFTTNISSANNSPLFGPGTPTFTSVPVGYAGGGGRNPLLANAGNYNLDLSDTADADRGRRATIYRAPRTSSLNATLRRQFNPQLQMFLDASSSRTSSYMPRNVGIISNVTIAANAPNNPFGQAIRVTVPAVGSDRVFTTKLRNDRIVAGLLFKLPADWTSEFDYTWTRGRVAVVQPGTVTAAPAALAAIMNGSVDVLKDTNLYPLDPSMLQLPINEEEIHTTILNDSTLRFAGSVLSLPGGPVTVSTLLEHREEVIPQSNYTFVQTTAAPRQQLTPRKSQRIDSAYVEFKLPLVSPQMERRGVRQLELQAALRHDRYHIHGADGSLSNANGSIPEPVRIDVKRDSTDPTVGLRWEPVTSLAVRASYGTGFLPPTMMQLVPARNTAVINTVIDPRRGNTAAVGAVQGETGGSPELEPEKSESWSGGLIIQPKLFRDWRLSVDYTRIKKSDNIYQPSAQEVANFEAVYPQNVVRGANLPGDLAGWAGPITFLSRRLINLSKAEVEAFDVALDGALATGPLGEFRLAALATWQTHYKIQLVPTSPLEENVGFTSNNPLKFKANLGLTWNRGRWTAGWNMRYFDSYLVANPAVASSATLFLNQGSGGRVSAQSYHDLFLLHRLAPHHPIFHGTEIQLGVKNVFNQEAPFDASASRPPYASYYGDSRLSTYFLAVKRAF